MHLSIKTHSTKKLHIAFEGAFKKSFLLRVLVINPFEDEFLIGMEKTGDQFHLVKIEATEDVLIKEGISIEQLKGKIRTVKREVSSAIASEIEELWKVSLLNVQHPQKTRILLDGTYYKFSMRLDGYGNISGHIVSPQIGTRTKGLTDLVDAMDRYVSATVGSDSLEAHLLEIKNNF